MRVITRKALLQFAQKHPDAKKPLARWLTAVTEAEWADFTELRRLFRSADQVRVGSGRTATVFNVGGNKYRLVTAVHYNTRIVFVMRIFTHKDYDQIDWKAQL